MLEVVKKPERWKRVVATSMSKKKPITGERETGGKAVFRKVAIIKQCFLQNLDDQPGISGKVGDTKRTVKQTKLSKKE